MQKITPCLWFDGHVEEAVDFYISVFKDAKLTEMSYYGDTHPTLSGQPLVATIELRGQPFMILNGGPEFKFSEAVSFSIACEDQAEVDYFWTALIAGGGEESVCGWLKDKYGLSWQVSPKDMSRYVSGPDKAGAERAMTAMMGMKKIDLAAIVAAYEGR